MFTLRFISASQSNCPHSLSSHKTSRACRFRLHRSLCCACRMQNVLEIPLKYGLKLNQLIEFSAVSFFFILTFTVLGSCLFILHPSLMDDEQEVMINSLYSVYIFINIIGNYYLCVTSKSYNKGGEGMRFV